MPPAPNIQYKPPFKGESGIAFEKGELVAVDQFKFPAEEAEKEMANSELEDIVRRAQHEAVVAVLQDLNFGNASPVEIGRRAIFQFHELRPEKTQDELAQQLGVTRQRVAQLLAAFKGKSPNVFNGN